MKDIKHVPNQHVTATNLDVIVSSDMYVHIIYMCILVTVYLFCFNYN